MLSHHKREYVEIPVETRKAIHNTIELQPGSSSLAALLKDIHTEIRKFPDFTALVEAAHKFTPSKETPSFCATLSHDEQYNLSLVGIHRFAPLPVHDHPDTDGALLVVHGRVQVRNYRVEESVRNPSLVRLQCLSEKILAAGSVATIDHSTNNLHGLQAMNLTSVCLVFHTPPLVEKQQAWYFPTHPLAIHSEHATWNRVVKRPRRIDAPHNCSPQFNP